MANAPIVLVISGPPGTGKTTLARSLAEHIGCPAIIRDEIKQGMVLSTAQPPAGGYGTLNLPVLAAFFETLTVLARAGVTVIAEAAFQDALWHPNLLALAHIAEIRVIDCTAAAQVRHDRITERASTDPHRRAHNDPDLLTAGAYPLVRLSSAWRVLIERMGDPYEGVGEHVADGFDVGQREDRCLVGCLSREHVEQHGSQELLCEYRNGQVADVALVDLFIEPMAQHAEHPGAGMSGEGACEGAVGPGERFDEHGGYHARFPAKRFSHHSVERTDGGSQVAVRVGEEFFEVQDRAIPFEDGTHEPVAPSEHGVQADHRTLGAGCDRLQSGSRKP